MKRRRSCRRCGHRARLFGLCRACWSGAIRRGDTEFIHEGHTA